MDRWKLPPHWQWREINDYVELNYGKGLPKGDRRGGEVKVYGANGAIDRHDVALTRGPTIVIGRKGSVGAVNFSETACWPIDTTYYIDEYPQYLDAKFLFCYLKLRKLDELDRSAAIPGLNRDDFYQVGIPIPCSEQPERSMVEQRRIVARIEALFAELSEMRELNDRITSDGNTLFKAVLENVFGKVNEDDWDIYEFGNLVENFDSRRIPVKKADRAQMAKIYRYYGASGIIDYVDDYLFDGEYLLISEDGANLEARKYPIAFLASGKFWVNNHAHVVKAKEITSNQYLAYMIEAKDISRFVTGAAQPKLNQTRLNEIPIWLPKQKSSQDRIVRYLTEVETETNRILEIACQDAKQLEQLEQAILAQAFRGEL